MAVKAETPADLRLPQDTDQQITATASPAPAALPPPPPPPLPVVRFPLPGLSLPTDFQPILQDHQAVLYPNYQTPFASAHDVIARLLPWHVWQVPDDIIALAKGKHFVPPGLSAKGKQKAIQQDDQGDAAVTSAVGSGSVYVNGQRAKKRKRASGRIEYGRDLVSVPCVERAASTCSHATFERIEGLDFPTMEDMEGIVPRYQNIHSRIRQIRHIAEGGKESKPPTDKEDPEPASALFARESHLQLLRQSHSDEKAELDGLLADLKQARFNMMAQYGGIWQTELDKVAPGLPAIPRDELYNPPPPPPPPRPRQAPPPPLPTSIIPQPALSATNASRQSPSTAASVTATSRATSMDKNDTSRAASKSKASSPTGSKSQSPVRQLSPSANNANAAKHRKRPSVAPAPRQSVGAAASNGTGVTHHATPPAPSSIPQTFPRPGPGQTGAPPPPHLPLHMQHQYTQSWGSPSASPTAAVPRPHVPSTMQGSPQLTPTGASPVAGGSGGTPVGGPSPASTRPPAMPVNGAAVGPSQPPIRVVLPLNLIQTLTDAGIAPQPAPHLKPAIEAHKRRAAQAWAQGNAAPPLVSRGEDADSPTGGYSTAPVDPDPNQKYPAVLLGITEAVVPGGGNQGERYQLVHLSLKLDKLEPNQLHALATAVNMVQGQQAPGVTAGMGASGTGNATAGVPVMGMQQQPQPTQHLQPANGLGQGQGQGQGPRPAVAVNQNAQGPLPPPQQQQQQTPLAPQQQQSQPK